MGFGSRPLLGSPSSRACIATSCSSCARSRASSAPTAAAAAASPAAGRCCCGCGEAHALSTLCRLAACSHSSPSTSDEVPASCLAAWRNGPPAQPAPPAPGPAFRMASAQRGTLPEGVIATPVSVTGLQGRTGERSNGNASCAVLVCAASGCWPNNALAAVAADGPAASLEAAAAAATGTGAPVASCAGAPAVAPADGPGAAAAGGGVCSTASRWQMPAL